MPAVFRRRRPATPPWSAGADHPPYCIRTGPSCPGATPVGSHTRVGPTSPTGTEGSDMSKGDHHLDRREFLRRAGVVSLGTIAARGVYELIDELGPGPTRAAAAPAVRRRQEQYLVDNVEVILDNGVTCAIPPVHNDVITAKLASGKNWTASALKDAQRR